MNVKTIYLCMERNEFLTKRSAFAGDRAMMTSEINFPDF